MISTLIALPYELARYPVTVFDTQLSERLADTSGVRVTLDRAIGSADKLAGSLLGNRAIAQRGVERLERSEKLVTAARLEQEAAVRRQQADETAAAGREEAARKRKAAQDRAASGLQEADVAEARGKAEAKAEAKRVAAAKKAAADQRAAKREATIEKSKQRVESSVESKRQGEVRAAKNELDDAHETAEAAESARADADRLHDLTEAKKQERKQG